MTTVPLIRLEDVGVTFAGRAVLEGIHLELFPGQITTVVGPNGAGKSTLARVILGLLTPTRGQVIRKPGLRMGYVPQRFHVDPTLPLTVQRFLADTREPLPEAMANALHLPPLLNKDLSTLSGGQLQRVLLARALQRRPDMLVLDEPAQGVDMHGQTELYSLIEQVVSELGCSVLMISHDLHWVMSSTSEVICLNGHICCSGPPQTVAGDAEFRQLFGPDAAHYGWFRHDMHHHTECDHSHDSDEVSAP
ncbi:MAG: metal ABC transporter ATP-binding protein [Gammaproteobacteria bacterium]|nr:MAG: metal ABC transporter ATP-binding protein [Gammaproteobacteria bacterium]